MRTIIIYTFLFECHADFTVDRVVTHSIPIYFSVSRNVAHVQLNLLPFLVKNFAKTFVFLGVGVDADVRRRGIPSNILPLIPVIGFGQRWVGLDLSCSRWSEALVVVHYIVAFRLIPSGGARTRPEGLNCNIFSCRRHNTTRHTSLSSSQWKARLWNNFQFKTSWKPK